MFGTVVDKLLVHFITQDEEVVLQCEVSDGLQLLARPDLPWNVLRGVDQNHLSLLIDGGLQFIHVHCPVGRRFRVVLHADHTAYTPSHLDVICVQVEERLEHDDLITNIDHRLGNAVQCLGCAIGDENFVRGDLTIHLLSIPLLKLFHKFQVAKASAVLMRKRIFALHCADRRLYHELWWRKSWESLAEVDSLVLHR